MGEHKRTEHDTRSPRRIVGVRLSALLEIIGFVAVTLVFSLLFDAGNRFLNVSPHPFWIPVLLVSAYYGANEGLAAAILSAAALLTGNLPEQGSSEDLSAWLLRVTAEPVLWFVAAIALGQVGESHRRERDRLRRNLQEVRQQADVISHAYERLAQAKSSLEKRVASQVQTVHTVYVASRAIERQSTDEVLIGIADLVRSVMSPIKFSLFLLNGQILEAAATEGWIPSNLLAHEFDGSSALFEAIVSRRQFLCVMNPVHEAVLGGQGVLAGPLVCSETGEILGMLKIEEIDFLDLHPSCVQNFRILCEWIGTAFANAQRVEQLQDGLYVKELH
jgi:polysaccharide biosynthesis protein PelD